MKEYTIKEAAEKFGIKTQRIYYLIHTDKVSARINDSGMGYHYYSITEDSILTYLEQKKTYVRTGKKTVAPPGMYTIEEAQKKTGVARMTMYRYILEKRIKTAQVAPHSPHYLDEDAINEIIRIYNRKTRTFKSDEVDGLLRIPEIMAYTGLAHAKIYSAMKNGALYITYSPRGKLAATKEDIDRYIRDLSEASERLTLEQAAKILGVTRERVRQYVKQGRISTLQMSKSGRHYLAKKDIEAYRDKLIEPRLADRRKPGYYTTYEASTVVDFSQQKISQAVRKGELPALFEGKFRYVKESDLFEWYQKTKTPRSRVRLGYTTAEVMDMLDMSRIEVLVLAKTGQLETVRGGGGQGKKYWFDELSVHRFLNIQTNQDNISEKLAFIANEVRDMQIITHVDADLKTMFDEAGFPRKAFLNQAMKYFLTLSLQEKVRFLSID